MPACDVRSHPRGPFGAHAAVVAGVASVFYFWCVCRGGGFFLVCCCRCCTRVSTFGGPPCRCACRSPPSHHHTMATRRAGLAQSINGGKLGLREPGCDRIYVCVAARPRAPCPSLLGRFAGCGSFPPCEWQLAPRPFPPCAKEGAKAPSFIPLHPPRTSCAGTCAATQRRRGVFRAGSPGIWHRAIAPSKEARPVCLAGCWL